MFQRRLAFLGKFIKYELIDQEIRKQVVWLFSLQDVNEVFSVLYILLTQPNRSCNFYSTLISSAFSTISFFKRNSRAGRDRNRSIHRFSRRRGIAVIETMTGLGDVDPTETSSREARAPR